MTNQYFILTFLSIITLLLSMTLLGTHLVKVRYRKIRGQVPNQVKFIHISDIHNKISFINGGLAGIINSKKPDFVVVTGDYAQNQAKLPAVIKELGAINAPVFMVIGNYERKELINFFQKKPITLDFLKKQVAKFSNLKLLINESSAIKIFETNILIYGFDNSSYGNEEYNLKEPKDSNHFHYRIMLAHSPRIINFITEKNIAFDHILVGHTHGRQVNIPYLFKTPYDDFHIGCREVTHNKYFSITTGLGTNRVPIRFNALPEIVVYNIE